MAVNVAMISSNSWFKNFNYAIGSTDEDGVTEYEIIEILFFKKKIQSHVSTSGK